MCISLLCSFFQYSVRMFCKIFRNWCSILSFFYQEYQISFSIELPLEFCLVLFLLIPIGIIIYFKGSGYTDNIRIDRFRFSIAIAKGRNLENVIMPVSFRIAFHFFYKTKRILRQTISLLHHSGMTPCSRTFYCETCLVKGKHITETPYIYVLCYIRCQGYFYWKYLTSIWVLSLLGSA